MSQYFAISAFLATSFTAVKEEERLVAATVKLESNLEEQTEILMTPVKEF